MPKPSTVNDLVSLIRRSRLVDDRRLDEYLRQLAPTIIVATPGTNPDDLLAKLTHDGLLTRFQADLLAAGRWRGFAVGGYRLLDKLGAGGMGTVYLAEPSGPLGGPRVALKVLTDRLAEDPIARERFAREAWAAAALAHRNIVNVLSVHTNTSPPFLVMEYVDGVTFQAAVARRGSFSAGTAAYCCREVALGLQRAADVGLVHRDVKPANLIVDRDGTVKVLDLGIVRVPGGGDLTQRYDTKTILGTADYLAPEQAVDSSNVDIRADVYSLGSTLFFLLAGHPPFPDGRADEKLARKQVEDPERIDRLRPDVPAGLADVAAKMLARRPGDRYQTPAEAAAALAPWADPDADFPAALFVERVAGEDQCAVTVLDRHPAAADAEPTSVHAVGIDPLRPAAARPDPAGPPSDYHTSATPTPTECATVPELIRPPALFSEAKRPVSPAGAPTDVVNVAPTAGEGGELPSVASGVPWHWYAAAASISAALFAALVLYTRSGH